MLPTNLSLRPVGNKQLAASKSRRPSGKPSSNDPLLAQLSKFRIDGQTINARNVGEIYPNLDRLLIRSLQTGDCRQLNNLLKRNLKPQYLLITGKHIHISVCSQTQSVLEKLVELGATLDLHFYEPIHMKELELMCQYGFDINERLTKYNNQTPLSIFINKHYAISMLDVLIRHGARFDLRDNQGQTCLHHACQPTVSDQVFDYIVEHTPDSCLNIANLLSATPVDLVYLSTYEEATLSRMRRLHVLLARRESKLTRYGMREPNLFTRKQYKLFDIMSCKEFLFKYRLKDLFDPSLRPLAWRLFLVYDVLRACEQRQPKLVGYMTNQQRLERYFTSMIENGEIAVDTIISQTNAHSSSSSTVTDAEDDQKIVTHTEKSLVHMAQIKSKLSELRMRTLTLKAMCRIKIKQEVRTFPNDILQLRSLSKILQAYLTFYNPFIKADVADRI